MLDWNFDPHRLVWRMKIDEGFREKAIFDTAHGSSQSQWTNGYGTKAKHIHESITKEEASKRLTHALDNAISYYLNHFNLTVDKMNKVRAEAFINMIFNLGYGGFKKFEKMNLALSKEEINWMVVAREAKDSRWYYQVGCRAERLVLELASGLYYYTDREIQTLKPVEYFSETI